MRISDWSSDVCSSDLGVVSRVAWWLRWSPSRPGAWIATSTAPPCRSLISRARPSASSRRASADNSAGNAISYSRATVEFLRVSACSAAFQSTARSLAHAGASAGTTRALCSTPCLRRSEEHTSELQSLMRISYAVFCLKKKKKNYQKQTNEEIQTHPY